MASARRGTGSVRERTHSRSRWLRFTAKPATPDPQTWPTPPHVDRLRFAQSPAASPGVNQRRLRSTDDKRIPGRLGCSKRRRIWVRFRILHSPVPIPPQPRPGGRGSTANIDDPPIANPRLPPGVLGSRGRSPPLRRPPPIVKEPRDRLQPLAPYPRDTRLILWAATIKVGHFPPSGPHGIPRQPYQPRGPLGRLAIQWGSLPTRCITRENGV